MFSLLVLTLQDLIEIYNLFDMQCNAASVLIRKGESLRLIRE